MTSWNEEKIQYCLQFGFFPFFIIIVIIIIYCTHKRYNLSTHTRFTNRSHDSSFHHV